MLMLAFTTTACTGAHDNRKSEEITKYLVVAGFERFGLYCHWLDF